MIFTEVHLLESRVYPGIGNLSKAKVGLLSRRVYPILIFATGGSQGQRLTQYTVLQFFKPPRSAVGDTHSRRQGLQDRILEAFKNLSAHGEENALGALKIALT